MRVDNGDIPPSEQVFLLRELQNLLEKQIELANQGNIKDVESLSRQASSLVEKCLQSRILEQTDLKNQREKLQKLYEQLSLALSAQRAETSEQLSQIRKGIKALHVYRGGI